MKKMFGGLLLLPTSKSASFRCLHDILALRAKHVPEKPLPSPLPGACAPHLCQLASSWGGDSVPPE